MAPSIIPLRIGKSLDQAAVDYGRLGFQVFPLKVGNKEPQIKGWQKAASNKEKIITEFWRKWPEANIGLLTGQASGFFVVDIDDRNGGYESLAKFIEEYGPLPHTAKQKTGNGEHYLFRCNKPIKCRTNALGPGIDIKGDGGYIVATPSLHPSGKQYQWVEDPHNLAFAPEWLLDALTSDKNPTFILPDIISVGTRDNTLFSYGCSLKSQGWSQSQIIAELFRANEHQCEAPLSSKQIKKITINVQKYGKKKVPLLFIWRTAIMEDSTLRSTTKHILHVIGFHMDTTGKPSWPSQEQIAREASVTRKTVNQHLQIAVKRGYLKINKHQAEGQKYANNIYLIPNSFKLLV